MKAMFFLICLPMLIFGSAPTQTAPTSSQEVVVFREPGRFGGWPANHGIWSWGDEIVLRRDGGSWDLGYPRTVQRLDGKLVTVYYFNTDAKGERFIGATIWDAGKAVGSATR
jgi:hypothetical protein